jgi:hypothetical protein
MLEEFDPRVGGEVIDGSTGIKVGDFNGCNVGFLNGANDGRGVGLIDGLNDRFIDGGNVVGSSSGLSVGD